jgi:hypothetical protein
MRVALLVGLAFLTLAPVSWAGESSCPKTTLEESWDRATVVFFGRAISREFISAPDATMAAGIMIWTVTTFEVEELWKGTPTNGRFSVRTCGGIAPDRPEGLALTCGGFRFDVGTDYLVFARGEPLDELGCGPTAQTDRAGALKLLANQPHTTLR